MALFLETNGELTPARPQKLATERARALVASLKRSVRDVVGFPLLPVTWIGDQLVAVDGAGASVAVHVCTTLTADELFAAVSRAGLTSHMSRSELASNFPGGPEKFDAAWREFSAQVPPERGPRLTLVLLEVEDDVVSALEGMSGGVRVIRAESHAAGSRRFVHLAEVGDSAARAGAYVERLTAQRPAAKEPAVHAEHSENAPADSGEPQASGFVGAPVADSGAPEPSERDHARATEHEQAQAASDARAAGVEQDETTPRRLSAARRASILSGPREPDEADHGPNETELPAYRSVRETRALRKLRKEQLLWERSAPRKEDGAERIISESSAADRSSRAVHRAAERARLSSKQRLQAIAARNHAPLTLRLGSVAGRLTAWGTIVVRGQAFSDPSEAASQVLGRPTDGWRAWTLDSGKPLEEA